MMYIDRNGETQVQSSPSIMEYEPAIFTPDVRERFVRAAAKITWHPGMPNFQSTSGGHMEGDVTGRTQAFPTTGNSFMTLHHGSGWYQHGLIPFEWQSVQNRRHRRSLRRVDSGIGPDSPSPTPAITWTPLRIGNKDLLRRYYEMAFENFQQLNCRAIAKAFVKLVEPRKQVNHPYNGRSTAAGMSQRVDPELTKPQWWPEGIRHREPDHLLKFERIRLLVHILCELRESHNITSEKLKDAGQDVRRGIVPEERLQVLDEIYYVRDMEELHLDGKIDGGTVIHVSQVQMPEASLTSVPSQQLTGDSVGDQSVPMIAVSNNHDTVPGADHLPPGQTQSQGSNVILTPNTSPAVSRRGSLESNMTGYSHNMTPCGLATNESIRAVQPSGPPSMANYYEQQSTPQPSGQPPQNGLWGQLSHSHQPLGFQGY
ncbi:DUF2841 domain-containing protein [Aspergillus affinis]|uniref:DUF2841 domain-containing protein n=1 Tax=Aspergillus affinis TaxID=1070780 RepID=UPI0022FE8228|nr:uncharacterized protein KD926_008014 [Aspergillus affinis]KAI9045598.1 hypothetical protein KD926_008014 [Aspergillus affinis]